MHADLQNCFPNETACFKGKYHTSFFTLKPIKMICVWQMASKNSVLTLFMFSFILSHLFKQEATI